MFLPITSFELSVTICTHKRCPIIDEIRRMGEADIDIFREEPREEEEVELEEPEKIINVEKIFKSEECTICLSSISKVLFCNCGHLCICVECDKTKSLKNCPICKTENTIKRIVD